MSHSEKKQTPALQREKAALKQDFNRDIQAFFQRNNVAALPQFTLAPENPAAQTHYVITGASFTAFDNTQFNNHPTHHIMNDADGNAYVMNNTAAIMKEMLDQGAPVICHSGNITLIRHLFAQHPNRDNLILFTGDLAAPSILPSLYSAIAESGQKTPIKEIRACLYKSFAQGADEPFKTLHNEDLSNIEDAAVKRFRFSYLMMVFAYDLLVNKKQGDLRMVVLSALAAQRASYGLMADAADKFANELAWKTFHKEANIALDNRITLYQVCPGITTACDIYDRGGVKDIVKRESIADGFPFDDSIMNGEMQMPQVSAADIATLSALLLTGQIGENPNTKITPALKDRLSKILWGGYEKNDLLARLKKALKFDKDGFRFGGRGELPDHIFAPDTYYGRLPKKIRKGDYARISITPFGQKF